MAVELRHRSWSDAAARHDRACSTGSRPAWVQIDEPKFRLSIRQDLAPNIERFYYLRLHGRNAAQWWSPDAPEDRYNYLYSTEELQPFADVAATVGPEVPKGVSLPEQSLRRQVGRQRDRAQAPARPAGHRGVPARRCSTPTLNSAPSSRRRRAACSRLRSKAPQLTAGRIAGAREVGYDEEFPNSGHEGSMRVVLADLKGRGGFVSKDTVAGGYGSRFRTVFAHDRLGAPVQDASTTTRPASTWPTSRPFSPTPATRCVSTDEALVDGRPRHRAVVARGLPQRDRVGRHDARARRSSRLRRADGVEDAAVVRRPCRLHPQRRARSGRRSGWPGASACRASASASRSGPRLAAVPALGPGDQEAPRPASGCRSRPVGGGVPAARQPRLPGVLHLLPAPDSGAGYRARSVGNIVDEIEQMCRRAGVRTSSSATRCSPSARPRASSSARQIRDARPAHPLRVRDAARPARRRPAARRCTEPGSASISFGVESVSPEVLKRVGPPPDPRGAPARHHRAVPRRWGSSTCGVLRARLPDRRLELDRGHDRVRRRTSGRRFAQFKMLTPYPGTPLWKQMEPRVVESRLGEVRRLHADLQAPEPDRRAS